MLTRYRDDIEALRGLSIIIVVLFHFFPEVVKSGFIGVDVFFVISGFLITNLLIGEKSYLEFYKRRVRRLFPAFALTLALSLIFGYIFLLPDEYANLAKYVIAAVTFSTNFFIIFDQKGGYFTDLNEGKQLLHLWSLAIEEQFYLIWPWLVMLLAIKKLKYVVLLLVVIFVSLTLKDNDYQNKWHYFFSIYRFWELCAGALILLWGCQCLEKRELNKTWVKRGAIVFIVLASFSSVSSQTWPNINTIFLVIAVDVYILFDEAAESVFKQPFAYVLRYFGLISYPLYLLHWVFIQFAAKEYRFELPFSGKLLLLILSVVLADLVFRFIERPIRNNKNAKPVIILLALVFLLGALSIFIYSKAGFPYRAVNALEFNGAQDAKKAEINRVSELCKRNYSVLNFNVAGNRLFCEQENDVTRPITIIGDSHAAKLYSGFRSLGYKNIVHLGKGSCPPMFGFDPEDPWYNCKDAVNEILKNAINSDSSILVLTGVFERYIDGTYSKEYNETEFRGKIEKWFEALSKFKGPVLIVIDNPQLDFNPNLCEERLININQKLDCSVDRELHNHEYLAYANIFKNEAERFSNLHVYDPTNLFCDAFRCYASNINGMLYESDNNHLNLRGSQMVVTDLMKKYNIFQSLN